MKRQFSYYLLLALLLGSSFSDVSGYQREPSDSIIKQKSFIAPKESSPLDLPFNSSALNWSYQIGYAFGDFDLWFYFHYNITCSIIESPTTPTSLIFNFTYRLHIDTEKGNETFYGLHGYGDSINIDAFWLLEVGLYHENSVDLCYLHLSNSSNDFKSGTYNQSLVLEQEHTPLGFFYRSCFSGKSYIFFSQSVYYNKSELSAFYDGNILWVKDLTNFTFTIHFHLNDFEFSLEFQGSYEHFLGDGINHANSTIEMEYIPEIIPDPLIITDFNVSHSLRSSFVNIFTDYSLGTYQDFHPTIFFNQSNYQITSLQEIEYMSTNSMDGILSVINGTLSPGVFNSTHLEQNIVFQLNTIPQNLIFTMPIKQIVPEDLEERDTSSITSFPFPLFIGGMILTLGIVSLKQKGGLKKEKKK